VREFGLHLHDQLVILQRVSIVYVQRGFERVEIGIQRDVATQPFGQRTTFGRADVILDKHEGKPDSLAIVDYKTSTEGRELDLQLQIYTVAGQREGLDVQGAFIHDLGSANRAPVDTSKKALDAAVKTVVAAAEGIKNREFEAKPTVPKCGRCDVRPICKAAAKAK
jgi:CRISPR/Cas system-associated exonuclease Cas4 (RecB family)